MKLLHEVRARIEGIVVFYGNGTPPCTHPFHEGYGCERWRALGHDDCIAEQNFTPVFETPEGRPDRYVTYCWCPTCRNRQHFTVVRWSERERALGRDAAGNWLCTDCKDDRHPEFADGHVRTENDQFENTERDHRHEGGRDRDDNAHHMGEFFDDNEDINEDEPEDEF